MRDVTLAEAIMINTIGYAITVKDGNTYLSEDK